MSLYIEYIIGVIIKKLLKLNSFSKNFFTHKNWFYLSKSVEKYIFWLIFIKKLIFYGESCPQVLDSRGGGAVYNRYKYNILITDFHFAKLEIIVFKTARVMIYLWELLCDARLTIPKNREGFRLC